MYLNSTLKLQIVWSLWTTTMSAFNIYYFKLSNPNFCLHIPSLALLWGMKLLPQIYVYVLFKEINNTKQYQYQWELFRDTHPRCSNNLNKLLLQLFENKKYLEFCCSINAICLLNCLQCNLHRVPGFWMVQKMLHCILMRVIIHFMSATCNWPESIIPNWMFGIIWIKVLI